MNTNIQSTNSQTVKPKRKIKLIKIDIDKCNGCRACEMICSAFHASPKYSAVNPTRSRIRVHYDAMKDLYVPVKASEFTEAECNGRHTYTIDKKEYNECAFCGASCPARNLFKEPDSGLPLKCDMCEDQPPQEKPLCVQWCANDALTYEEKEVEGEEEEKPGEMEIGLQQLVSKHGLKTILDTLSQMEKD